MKKKTKTVTQRLHRVKTFEGQQVLLSEWCKNWENDQKNVLYKLQKALQDKNYDEVNCMISHLKGMTEKRFTALNNVLNILTDSERKLTHYSDTCNTDDKVDVLIDDDSIMESKVTEDKNSIIHNNNDIDIVVEIIKRYNDGVSVKEISDWIQVNTHKVIKILVTEGIYRSETYDKIKFLREKGETDTTIAARLNLKRAAMNDYTPYKKVMYNMGNPSENAIRVRKCRQEKIKD